MSRLGDDGGDFQYDWLPTISWVLSATTKNAAIAVTGAVNRLGSSVPAANPSAAIAASAAAAPGRPPQRPAPVHLVRGHPVDHAGQTR